ncbi:NAD(P)/FAD-dependent oxidoreductase [Candidatus Pacearchaeota archaeon]|nr:NAD(P)/FAD-dependent oxidoreductase [Candidatus Pacearchaeota archaeon]
MKKYDVIIIGAGPGGLSCAIELGKSKKRVLLIEKNNVIGTKVCAGGLTYKDLKEFKIPMSLIEKRFDTVVVHSKHFKANVKSDNPLVCTVNRENLGQWMIKKLNKNIVVMKGKTVSKIGNGYVVVNNEKIGFESLVGADGSNSLVRKYLKLKLPMVGVGIQYRIPTKKYNDLELFLDSRFFNEWYAWIFPHKTVALIGTGYDSKVYSGKVMHDNLDKWIKRKDIDVTNASFEGAAINGIYQSWDFGNIFLCGDSAGLTSSLTGEGIYAALVSGQEVAKKILDKNYESIKMSELIKINKSHLKIVKFFMRLGIVRNMVFDISVFLLKFKYFQEKALKRIA